MPRQESKQQSELPRPTDFDRVLDMKKSIHATSSFSSSSSSSGFSSSSKKLDDDVQVLGYCSSEWLVPTMVLGFCGGISSAFSPVVGGLLSILGFLCLVALLKSFLKTIEKIAKVSES